MIEIMSTTAVEHLREVLTEILAHLDAAPHGLVSLSIRGGHVYLESTPEDLRGLVTALHMAEPNLRPHAISSGDSHVIVPLVAEATYAEHPWRVWAPVPITPDAYRALVAQHVRRPTAATQP